MIDPSKAIVRALGDYLKAEMPDLADVIENFPAPNEELTLPTLSIFIGKPEFANHMPYQISQGATNNHQAPIGYVVGTYEMRMQLDLWCGSKEERYKLFDQLFAAINKEVNPMGLSLPLTEYRNEICRYDISGYQNAETEQDSQQAEWRVRVDVLATCRAVLTKNAAIITEPIETNLETPDTI